MRFFFSWIGPEENRFNSQNSWKCNFIGKKKKRSISERNKWFYAECDWSLLYFSSYQQRRVFLSSGWFVTKVSFMSRVMYVTEARHKAPFLALQDSEKTNKQTNKRKQKIPKSLFESLYKNTRKYVKLNTSTSYERGQVLCLHDREATRR